MKPNNSKISKFLSLVLRHKPEVIGLKLDKHGWVSTKDLLAQMTKNGKAIDLETLKKVVATNNKKRFAFNEDESMIRASQGHSLNIDLNYSPTEPPETLFHGTATRFIESIKEKGLIKGSRDQLHLSKDLETASKVGLRHGKLFILKVDALKMYQDGYQFFVSENGVWLTDHVPTKYLIFPKD